MTTLLRILHESGYIIIIIKRNLLRNRENSNVIEITFSNNRVKKNFNLLTILSDIEYLYSGLHGKVIINPKDERVAIKAIRKALK